MNKTLIKLAFQNGLNFSSFNRDVFELANLHDHFDFVESDNPDFIIFGPYGNDLPQPGNYIRIGYYCENFIPDMNICEWAFGVPIEEEIKHPRYKRIQWHGTDPETLVKPFDYDAAEIARQNRRFCNFLYSHRIPYRETFFKQLSKYKKVDSPGLSMNNMPSIDTVYPGDQWQRKRNFLSNYKFTIAFENYVYPGYQTEKLYDAMQSDSIPIYCGDPDIGSIFNTASFVNVGDYVNLNRSVTNSIGRQSQADFTDIRPSFFNNPQQRIKRKVKTWGRELRMNLLLTKKDIDKIIDRVVELDNNENEYKAVLSQPWLINNLPPADASRNRWIEIFENKRSD